MLQYGWGESKRLGLGLERAGEGGGDRCLPVGLGGELGDEGCVAGLRGAEEAVELVGRD